MAELHAGCPREPGQTVGVPASPGACPIPVSSCSHPLQIPSGERSQPCLCSELCPSLCLPALLGRDAAESPVPPAGTAAMPSAGEAWEQAAQGLLDPVLHTVKCISIPKNTLLYVLIYILHIYTYYIK